MRKFIHITAIVCCVFLLQACNMNSEFNGFNRSRRGEIVQFGVENSGLATKTNYSGERDGANMERINWVDGDDHIRIYNADGYSESDTPMQYADYAVTGTTKTGKYHKGTIAPLAAGGSMKWGDTDPQRFYSVYPIPGESGAGNLAMNANVVTAVLPEDQSFATSKTNDLSANYYADMKWAYMTATASGHPYGEDLVTLSFTPIVTTFYITVYNPSSTNVMNLRQIILTSSNSVLTGKYEATIATDNSRTYKYYEGGAFGNTWTRTDDNSTLTFNWTGSAIPADGSVTVALFAVPHDITNLKLTVIADEGTSRLDIKKNDTWITFAGGCKHNLNNVRVPDWIYNIEVDQNTKTAAMDGSLANTLDVKCTKTYGADAAEQAANEMPTPWKTQIQIDTDSDDIPDTWIDLADATPAQWPAWMPADFPTGDSPTTTDFEEQPEAVMTAQPVQSHEDRLRSMADVIEDNYRNPNGSFNDERLDLSMWNFVNHSLNNRTTANCYIVQGPGKYRFPMVYGNAIDMLCWNTSDNTPSYNPGDHPNFLNQFRNHVRNATDYAWTFEPYRIQNPWISRDANFGQYCTEVGILWKDYDGDVITNVTTYTINTNDRFIYFDVPAATIKPGNALIYVKDTNLTEENKYGSGHPIAWTWHIWITDQSMNTTQIKNLKSSAGWPVQPVNLGWVDDSEGIYYPQRNGDVRFVIVECQSEYEDVTFQQTPREKISTSGHGLYYQWGRKDPIRAETETVMDENHHLYFAVRHPDKFIAYHSAYLTEYDWTDNEYKNLWRAENTEYGMSNRSTLTGRKTVYDPCPRGYIVPPGNTWDDIMKASGNTWTGSGWWFPTGFNDGTMIFMPADGYLRVDTDKTNPLIWTYENYRGLQNQGSKGYYWTDFPANTGDRTLSIALKFDSTSMEIADDYMRGYGASVRCVRDDKYTAASEGGTTPDWVY